MRTLILTLVSFIISATHAYAEVRVWKDRLGNEIKAEWTRGVLNNRLVLKLAGNQRRQVRLSELSLEDRDYVVEQLTAKKNEKDTAMLAGLMLFENQIPVIDPDVAPAKPANGGRNEGYNPNPDSGNPFNPLDNPNAGNLPAEIPTEMYGLALPSPELLVDDSVRPWTSLTGLKQMASFDRVLAPGFLRLKKADGTKGTFALVNFTKADIEYVKTALQRDMAREVFPEGNGFQSLNPDQIAKGYKVWNDRKNVPLIGKFVNVKAKNVVIEVDGEEREYPKAGLSVADREWVDGEIKSRADAAAQQAPAQQQAAQQAAANNGQGRFSPFGNRNTGAGSSFGGHGEGTGNGSGLGGSVFPTIQYSFTCDNCGKTWTDSTPISQCSECAGKFHFTCRECGHKWTTTDSMISNCPQCAARKNSQASGYSALSGRSNVSSSPTPKPSTFGSSTSGGTIGGSSKSDSDSGVLMTILYVAMGVGLLAGIAVGLFKAFG